MCPRAWGFRRPKAPRRPTTTARSTITDDCQSPGGAVGTSPVMTDPHHDFAGLVARYQGAVCAVAYSVLRDRARSEEVAQDAFLLAWQKLPGMSPAPALPGWVCGIARNLARNAARRRKETEMMTEPAALTTPLDLM